MPAFIVLVVGDAHCGRNVFSSVWAQPTNLIPVLTGLRVTLNPFPIHQTDSSGRLFGHLTLVDLSLADLLTVSAPPHCTQGSLRPPATFFLILGSFYLPNLPSFHVTASGSLPHPRKPPIQRSLLPVLSTSTSPSFFLRTIHRHTTDTTADILSPLSQDTAGAPQSTTPPSLRKLAMSHLMGAALSANTSPTIHANGHGPDDKVHYGALPPPGAPALTNALKTLTTVDSVTSNPQPRPNYDSPYSRSISSTAPASPRM